MCPIKLINLFHSHVSEHLSTCTHGVSEIINCIFVNVKFPRYNSIVVFDGRDEINAMLSAGTLIYLLRIACKKYILSYSSGGQNNYVHEG